MTTDHVDWAASAGAPGPRTPVARRSCHGRRARAGFGHDFHKHPPGRADHGAGGTSSSGSRARRRSSSRRLGVPRQRLVHASFNVGDVPRACSSARAERGDEGYQLVEWPPRSPGTVALTTPARRSASRTAAIARRAGEHARGVRGRDHHGADVLEVDVRVAATARWSPSRPPTRPTRRGSPTCSSWRPLARAAQPRLKTAASTAADRARAAAGLAGRVTCTGGNWALLAGIHRAEPGIRGPHDAAAHLAARAPAAPAAVVRCALRASSRLRRAGRSCHRELVSHCSSRGSTRWRGDLGLDCRPAAEIARLRSCRSTGSARRPASHGWDEQVAESCLLKTWRAGRSPRRCGASGSPRLAVEPAELDQLPSRSLGKSSSRARHP